MKRYLTLCAVTSLFIGVNVPVAAVAVPEPLPTGLHAANRVTALPQTFAASDIAMTPVVRDAFGVEQIVVEVVEVVEVAQVVYDTYVAPVSGLLAMWPSSAPVNDGFGYRNGGDFHKGIDIMSTYGSPLVAASPGVVEAVADGGGWGQYVKIDHGGGVSTLYAHLIYGSPTVSVGQAVSAGEVIGLTGDTGNVTAPHLHFEVYVDGTRVDPYAWLP